jgi:hypothetical protein
VKDDRKQAAVDAIKAIKVGPKDLQEALHDCVNNAMILD